MNDLLRTSLALLCLCLLLTQPAQAKERKVLRMADVVDNSIDLPLGEWGGEHVRLELTADGGSVEFDCAHGALDDLPKLDAKGYFLITGTYEQEHGGPIRAGASPKSIKVEYAGSFKRGKLRLSVRRVGAKRAFAVFHLRHGQAAMLVKCR